MTPTGIARRRYNFTAAVIERLPTPQQGRAAYFDTKTRGLCLRVTPDGARVFYLVRSARRREWTSTPGSSFWTEDLAGPI